MDKANIGSEKPARTRVLVVDDDPGTLELCSEALGQLPETEIVIESRSSRAAERLQAETFDLLVTDIHMPGLSGIELLRNARKRDPDMPVLMMTGYPGIETAVESMKLGAMDYLAKPFLPQELVASVQSLLESKRLREENRLLRRQVERTYCCGDLLGKSAVMQKVCDRIQRVAQTDFDVLIVGETGTGKELVAHAIHHRSRRSERPFVPVNCGAIPEDLLESEFFGHERGAFTGAQTRSLGLMEFANHGTFFLDELNQLPLRLQGKLLRVVQERRIRRVGSTRETEIDVRIMAASSVSLEAAVKQEQFRPDLYHRLNVARIELPPLRERLDDIPVLVKTFVERYSKELGREPAGVTPAVMEALIDYSWPGNVRELQNIVKRALTWARHEDLILEDLPEEIVARAKNPSRRPLGGFFHLRERCLATFEQDYLTTVLRACSGDVSAAAREAQLPRGTLYRLMKKHQLKPSGFRDETQLSC